MKIAVDLGKTGAISFCFGGEISIEDMPMKGKDFDVAALAQLLREATDSGATKATVIMENVHAMPTGTVANFSMGYTFGLFMGLCEALNIAVVLVRPTVWKKAMKLGKDKSQSLALARELFPQFASELKLQKHHNRAESLLLLHYLQSNYQ